MPTPPITTKRYRCRRCGHETEQNTNHYGSTLSWGRVNTCPECPPWAKYPEFGGQTVWDCIDTPEPRPNICTECGGNRDLDECQCEGGKPCATE